MPRMELEFSIPKKNISHMALIINNDKEDE